MPSRASKGWAESLELKVMRVYRVDEKATNKGKGKSRPVWARAFAVHVGCVCRGVTQFALDTVFESGGTR